MKHKSNYDTLTEDANDNQGWDDDIDRLKGVWGPWHIKIICLAFLHGFFGFMHVVVFSLYVPQADHWCKPPELFSNLTDQEWKSYSIPREKENPEKFEKCLMYNMDYSKFPEELKSPNDNISTTKCLFGWEYDRSPFTVTIENEWDLVCSHEFLAKTAASTYNAGMLIGVLLFGQLSDMYGRRAVYVYTTVVATVLSFLTCITSTFWMFCVLRFFTSMTLNGGGVAGFILVMESVDRSMRGDVGMILNTSGSMGFILLTLVAYFGLTDWRFLQLFMSLGLVFALLFMWLLPESYRWLISKGRTEEAYEIINDAAKKNGRVMPPYKAFSVLTPGTHGNEPAKTSTVLDLFRSPNMRKKTLNIYFNWFVNSFVYYGITLGANSLGGDVFVNSFASAAVEIPSSVLALVTLRYFGRRLNLCGFMVVGGLVCLCTGFFEKGTYSYDWPIVSLAMVGKLCINASFGVIYIFSAETYPTVARNIGLGSSSVAARIGSIIAPYMDLLRHLHTSAPLLAYGTTSVLAGGLILNLPETKDQPIPETFEEAEKITRESR